MTGICTPISCAEMLESYLHGRELMKATDKIRVLETLPQTYHREVVDQLKECLKVAKDDPSIRTVIVCMEDSQKTIFYYWSACDDRTYLGSRLVAVGLKRLGLR